MTPMATGILMVAAPCSVPLILEIRDRVKIRIITVLSMLAKLILQHRTIGMAMDCLIGLSSRLVRMRIMLTLMEMDGMMLLTPVSPMAQAGSSTLT